MPRVAPHSFQRTAGPPAAAGSCHPAPSTHAVRPPVRPPSQPPRSYAFLYDEKLPAERQELRAALKRAKGAAARADLQARLSRVEQQLRSEEARRKRAGFKEQVKVGAGLGGWVHCTARAEWVMPALQP